MQKILFFAIFIIATSWLYYLTKMAPKIGSTSNNGEIAFPSSIEDLKLLTSLLKIYYAQNSTYVLCLFCSAYIYKQAFMIPGSALLNILAGAVFGVWLALALCCLLTGLGASCSYFLSKMFLRGIVEKKCPNKIRMLQQKVTENKDQLIFFLLFLRLFPITPNWLLNLISPIAGVSISMFFITVSLGLIPYNYVCVQSGAILATITSLNDVFTTRIILQLGGLALAALGPGIFFKYSEHLHVEKPK